MIDLEELARWLVDAGYRAADVVELPGEFSRRGGIFDVYSPDADAPYRGVVERWQPGFATP